MRNINLLGTLYSLTALFVIIERLSPTTRILLQPNNFIRLHEINQTVIFLFITVIISFLFLRIVTDNFQALKERTNVILAAIFVGGVYLYGAGEGWHEVASFLYNSYCHTNQISVQICSGLFINDYYAGNLIFFIGGVMMNTALLALAAKLPMKKFTNKDMIILVINSLVYGFTWFAYAAFDVVLLGLFFAALLMVISYIFFFIAVGNNKFRVYPYITYSVIAYTFATLVTLLVRFH